MNKLNLGQEYKFSDGLVRYDIIGYGQSENARDKTCAWRISNYAAIGV
jgi:hypothetical protein